MTDMDMKAAKSIHQKIIESRTQKAGGASGFGGGNPRRARLFSRTNLIVIAVALTAVGGVVVLSLQSLSPSGTIAKWWNFAVGYTRGSSSGTTASDDPFLANASALGAKVCASTYSALGKMLTAGSQFAVQTQVPKEQPDQRGLQGLVGMRFGNEAAAAAGVVFAAPNNGRCDGEMVRVVPFSQNCSSAAGLLPKDSRALPALNGVAVYEMPTGGHAMLLPAASGCIAISVLRSAN